MRRMSARGRGEEGGVSLDYLANLHSKHEEWLRSGALRPEELQLLSDPSRNLVRRSPLQSVSILLGPQRQGQLPSLTGSGKLQHSTICAMTLKEKLYEGTWLGQADLHQLPCINCHGQVSFWALQGLPMSRADALCLLQTQPQPNGFVGNSASCYYSRPPEPESVRGKVGIIQPSVCM